MCMDSSSPSNGLYLPRGSLYGVTFNATVVVFVVCVVILVKLESFRQHRMTIVQQGLQGMLLCLNKRRYTT